jgi:AraC family transcriptional regulator of adaptative response / DNA-3-methyladenine glycosylase II
MDERDTERVTGGTTGWIELGLPYRAPLPLATLIEFLDLRAVPGVEQVTDGAYHRVLRLPGGPGIVSLGPAGPADAAGTGDPAGTGGTAGPPGTARTVACRMRLADPRDRPAAVAACRRLLDLDADPAAVDGALARDPLLAPLVAATPGRRAPGHVDPDELAVRAVLGQQVSLRAARHLAGRLAALCGDTLGEPVHGLTVGFPAPAAVAEADLGQLGMPGTRRATVRALARALADGDISLAPGADPDEAEHRLLEIRGIGPWTASYIRMRALDDPDVLLTTDLGVRHALLRLGVDPAGDDLPARWSPWGSYAVQHLWASLARDV